MEPFIKAYLLKDEGAFIEHLEGKGYPREETMFCPFPGEPLVSCACFRRKGKGPIDGVIYQRHFLVYLDHPHNPLDKVARDFE